MGFRYRKSIKIAPGVKLNVGKKSVGMSVGNKYGGISVNSRNGTTSRVSIPGTGISYSTKLNSATKQSKKEKNISNEVNVMPLKKCPSCNFDLRYGTEQVGIDNNNIPIYHRFGYCDTCRSKYDIDISSVPKYEEKNISDKKKSRKWWIVLLVLLFVFYAIGNSNNSDETADNESINQESKSDIVNEKYLTEITWASLNNYCFAVETDTYDGDIVESGTYRFYPDLVVENSNKLPQVWDVYVSNNFYESLNMLQDSEYITTIGGFGKDEITIELKSGQYVYIKTIKMQGESTGLLRIKRQ